MVHVYYMYVIVLRRRSVSANLPKLGLAFPSFALPLLPKVVRRAQVRGISKHPDLLVS